MAIFKYKNPTTGLWEAVMGGAGLGGVATGIPIVSSPSEDTTVWIDPYEDLSGNVVKVATGKYIGTGTYGRDNPNSITFDFVPKLVIIQNENAILKKYLLAINGVTGSGPFDSSGSSSYQDKFTWNEKTFSWYHTGNNNPAFMQYNEEGVNYYYFAVGDNISTPPSGDINIDELTTISIVVDGQHYSNIPKNITWYDFVNTNILGQTIGYTCTDLSLGVYSLFAGAPLYNESTGNRVIGSDILTNNTVYIQNSSDLSAQRDNGEEAPPAGGPGDVNGNGIVEPGEGNI